MATPRVRKEHFVDHGERDADGYYDYYYAYWEYEIAFGERRYGVRVYDNENVGFVVAAPSPRRADRNPEELAAVLDMLRPEGVREIRMLGGGGGYERVELPARRP